MPCHDDEKPLSYLRGEGWGEGVRRRGGVGGVERSEGHLGVRAVCMRRRAGAQQHFVHRGDKLCYRGALLGRRVVKKLRIGRARDDAN